MGWETLIGTGLGAVVGAGSTLLADRVRWRRERDTRQKEVQRQLYGDYLAALERTRTHLKDLRRLPELAPGERARQVRDAFREGGTYELAYRIAITAPHSVVRSSEEAQRKLRDLRDALIRGTESGTRSPVQVALRHAIGSLREAMRSAVGTDA
ncbi:hypothetical protein ACFU99_11940 [Streptomyces sp. NPDC057654]|uniref:hypothetical protein n=1 Tax=Streptomyces sp. NPDC057654 TaxID=3346196 RepID=UPI0036CFEA95